MTTHPLPPPPPPPYSPEQKSNSMFMWFVRSFEIDTLSVQQESKLKLRSLGLKQQNCQATYQLSETTLFAVWQIRQFFSQSERIGRLDPLPPPPLSPSSFPLAF